MRHVADFDSLLADTLAASRDTWRRGALVGAGDSEKEAVRALSLARVDADMARGEAEEERFPELLEDAA